MTASPSTVGAISGLRNNALMMVLANEYICEEPFLKKIANLINVDINNLEDGIKSLKKQFPGKFKYEVDAGVVLDKIKKISDKLKMPEEVQEGSVLSQLGSELENYIISIIEAIEQIKLQVEGVVSFTAKDSVSNVVDGITDIGRSIGDIIVSVAKISVLIVFCIIFAFCCLYFTLPREKVFLQEISEFESQINVIDNDIAQWMSKIDSLAQEIKWLEKGSYDRVDKRLILTKDLEVRELNVMIEEAEAEKKTLEDGIDENIEIMEGIRTTPLYKRLLRMNG